MQSKARHILVVRKANSDRAARLEAEIGAWLRARGHSVTAISGGFDDPAYALPDLDFAVVLGGDGTMLGVARRVAGRGIPLLGINFGRVGFLADIQPEQWEKGLADSLAGITPERT
ncbi:NAD(+)/NADH kinase, partial [Desulfovibrio piger]